MGILIGDPFHVTTSFLEGRETEAGFRRPKTGKLSPSTQK